MVERSTRVETAERRGPLGRDDGAERVCYTDFSANPRVFLLTSAPAPHAPEAPNLYRVEEEIEREGENRVGMDGTRG
jgi:hypothetical protein